MVRKNAYLLEWVETQQKDQWEYNFKTHQQELSKTIVHITVQEVKFLTIKQLNNFIKNNKKVKVNLVING